MLSLEEKTRRANWRTNCGTCGVVFGWRKNGDKGKYCSQVCAGRANGRIVTNFGRLRQYTCARCKKDFQSYHKNRRYCCRACSQQDWSEAMPGGFRGRLDDNHRDVVAALEKAGALVLDMSHVGKGFPDLIVGFRNKLMLMEIKNPKTAYGRKGLNPKQIKWHEKWAGYPVSVVDGPDAALRHLRVLSA